MTPNEQQADFLGQWGWVSPAVLGVALREAARVQDSDLCKILLSYNHISTAQAQAVRLRCQSESGEAAPQIEADITRTFRLTKDDRAQIKKKTAHIDAQDKKATARLSRRRSTRSPKSPFDNLIGTTIGPYKLVQGIAAGGCGAVVKALHEPSKRWVAVKIIFDRGADEEEFRKYCGRFEREARVLTSIQHSNIVRGYEFGVDLGYPFLIMEYIEGQNLREIASETQRNRASHYYFDWVISVHRCMADALLHCHGQGIIHRDVKPSNIVLERQTRRPVLVDFGLVKGDRSKLEAEWYRTLSTRGEIVGTPAFMAPEQVDARGLYGQINEKTDVWGLASSLFFSLTGSTPYSESTAVATCVALLSRDPRRVRDIYDELPQWIDDVIALGLTRTGNERPSLVEFARLLDRKEA